MEERKQETTQKRGKKNFFLTHLFDFLLLGILAIGTGIGLGVQIHQQNTSSSSSLVATVLYEGKPMEIPDAQGKNRNPFDLSKIISYEEIEIRGAKTTLTIGIDHNAIEVVHSGCPGQECVHVGKVTTPNRPIVCAHNGIYIDIQGGDDDVIIM